MSRVYRGIRARSNTQQIATIRCNLALMETKEKSARKDDWKKKWQLYSEGLELARYGGNSKLDEDD